MTKESVRTRLPLVFTDEDTFDQRWAIMLHGSPPHGLEPLLTAVEGGYIMNRLTLLHLALYAQGHLEREARKGGV